MEETVYTPKDFFGLPDYLQRKILIEELDLESINNLCMAVKQEEQRGPQALKFHRDFCSNAKFWRDKFQYDFPGSFNYVMGVADRDGKADSAPYWASVYNNYSRNMPLVRKRLMEIARTGEMRENELAGYMVRGVDLNIQDENGRTPLMVAAMYGNIGVLVGLLVGTDLNIRDNNGETALTLALWNKQPHVAEFLLDMGPLVSNLEVDIWDLFAASLLGYVGIVERLIASGPDINAADGNGETALMKAAMYGNFDIVERLLAAGANVNAQRVDGFTALMLTSFTGHPDIVERLRVSGADVDAQNNNGDTALILALKGFELDLQDAPEIGADPARIKDKYITTIRELIRYRPDPTLQNNEGVTAIDLAERFGLDDIVNTLKYLRDEKEGR